MDYPQSHHETSHEGVRRSETKVSTEVPTKVSSQVAYRVHLFWFDLFYSSSNHPKLPIWDPRMNIPEFPKSAFYWALLDCFLESLAFPRGGLLRSLNGVFGEDEANMLSSDDLDVKFLGCSAWRCFWKAREEV